MSDFPTSISQSQELCDHLESFVHPLLGWLDEQIDKRLVRTFLLTLGAIVTFRHTMYGLLLSELGAYVISADKAPAGTKRLSNKASRTTCAFKPVRLAIPSMESGVFGSAVAATMHRMAVSTFR